MSITSANNLSEFADTKLPRLMIKAQATGGSILLAHNETLMVHSARGLKDERGRNARIPIGVGVTGQAARSGEVQWVPDVEQRDNYIEGVEGANWELTIPLQDDGQRPTLIFDFESDRNEYPDQSVRDEIVRYLTVRQGMLLNFAERACYRRLSRTDTLSSLMDSDSFIQDVTNQTPGGLFIMDLEPTLDTATVSAFNELKTVLRKIGETLAATLSDRSLLTRFYGTTFGAFIPGITPDTMDQTKKDLHHDLAGTCSVKHVNSSHVIEQPDVQVLIDEAFVDQTYSNSDQADKRLALNEVINTGDVELFYQPIQHVRFKRNVGHEILVRGPDDSPLRSPKELFRTAYRNGRIGELDRLITRKALSEYPTQPDRTVFLNVERKSIASHDWRTTFIDGVRSMPDGATVCVEVTEHDNLSALQAPIDDLRDKLGSSILFAVDDFGTGSSNFRSVLNLSPDVVKLDRSLINHLDENFEKRSLVKSVLSFSSQADIDVVAEGIERQAEWKTIRGLGAKLAQGYYFARPAPLCQLDAHESTGPARTSGE